jgi:hypothetical protein
MYSQYAAMRLPDAVSGRQAAPGMALSPVFNL